MSVIKQPAHPYSKSLVNTESLKPVWQMDLNPQNERYMVSLAEMLLACKAKWIKATTGIGLEEPFIKASVEGLTRILKEDPRATLYKKEASVTLVEIQQSINDSSKQKELPEISDFIKQSETLTFARSAT